MNRIDKEEDNSKCNICAQGLSLIEHYLYGNRCLFCASSVSMVGLIDYLLCAYYDWRIYNALLAYKGKANGRIILIACLGALGLIDINQADTVKIKRELLKQINGGNWRGI